MLGAAFLVEAEPATVAPFLAADGIIKDSFLLLRSVISTRN
jgi:hypothetical protein